jgi:hypothetical protein
LPAFGFPARRHLQEVQHLFPDGLVGIHQIALFEGMG